MHFEATSFQPALNEDATPVVTLRACGNTLHVENQSQKACCFRILWTGTTELKNPDKLFDVPNWISFSSKPTFSLALPLNWRKSSELCFSKNVVAILDLWGWIDGQR